jgi:hypothetical protein
LARIGERGFIGNHNEAMGTYLIFEDLKDETEKVIDCKLFDKAFKSVSFVPIKLAPPKK